MNDVWLKTLWIYGLLVIVSLLISLLIKLVVVALERLERRDARVPDAVTSSAPRQVVADDPGAIAAEHIVAISAAVYAAMGSHRIVHIARTRHGEAWLAEGRLAQHASHGLEHHPKH